MMGGGGMLGSEYGTRPLFVGAAMFTGATNSLFSVVALDGE